MNTYLPFLTRYLRPLRGAVALLALLLFSGITVQLINPQILRYFLDTTQGSGSQTALLWAAALYIVFAFTQQGLNLASNYVSRQVAWRATNAVRRDLLLHTLRLDLEFHKTHTPGVLIERIDGDAGGLGNFLSQFVLHVIGHSVLIVGILALLYREDWRVGVGLTVYAAVVLVVLTSVQGLATGRWQAQRAASAELFGFLEERIAGAEDIRAAGAMPAVLHQLLIHTRTFLERFRAAVFVASATFGLTSVLTAVGYASGLGLGVFLYTRGEATIGTAYLMVSYVAMLTRPLEMLRHQLGDFQQASASLRRVQGLLDQQPRVAEPAAPQPLPAGALAVEFSGVSFHYEDNANVLHDVALAVPPGRVLGVLGRTGSGKSTLTRLLFRLYDPTAGRITLGGHDLRDVAVDAVRGRVGMVTQEVQLFQASLRDNLCFFNRAVPETALVAALKALRIWEWVAARPGGLEAPLAAGGQGLSAGEAQLLAFARVFLKNPGLVILDEASSRLDPATETLLERAVDQLLAGRTAIIIAHRLRTVQRADDILILEDGRVVEYGPRVALAANPGSRFAQLLQTGLEGALA